MDGQELPQRTSGKNGFREAFLEPRHIGPVSGRWTRGQRYIPGLGRWPVGLGRSASVSDFLLKAIGTQRRASK